LGCILTIVLVIILEPVSVPDILESGPSAMIETILITSENQQTLAERFRVQDDFDVMLPPGDILLTDVGDTDDYDLIEVFTN
jgi:hypothetical protein